MCTANKTSSKCHRVTPCMVHHCTRSHSTSAHPVPNTKHSSSAARVPCHGHHHAHCHHRRTSCSNGDYQLRLYAISCKYGCAKYAPTASAHTAAYGTRAHSRQ